jgi:WD40 repeat protein
MLWCFRGVVAGAVVLAVAGQGRPLRPEEGAAAELRRLERLAKEPGAGPETLWDGLLALRQAYPDTAAARRAGVLLSRARSPLDQLDAKQIPTEERFGWQPEGLVAVLGEHRARHWGSLARLQFSRSGKFVVSSSDADGVRIWDAASMRLLLWHKAGWAFALSPDGKQLAIGEGIGVIRVYDLDGEARLRERLVLRKPRHYIEGITFAPGSKGLAVKYRQEPDLKAPAVPRPITDVYVLWDWSKGKPRQEELPRRDGAHANAVFTADGKILVHGETGSKLYLWNVGKEAPGLRAELEEVSAFALSPDDKMLAANRVGSYTITLWDITAVPPKELTNFDDRRVNLTGFSPDGRLLAGLDWLHQDRLFLWSVQDLVEQARHKQPPPAPRVVNLPFRASIVAFAPDGRRLALGGRYGSVHLWDLVNSKELFPPRVPSPDSDRNLFSPDGRTLATASKDSLRLWDLSGARPRESFARRFDRDEAAQDIAFAPGGGLLAFATSLRAGVRVRVWDLRGKVPRQAIAFRPHHRGDSGCLAFDPRDERRLLLLGAREATPDQWHTALSSWKVDAGRGTAGDEQCYLTGEAEDESNKVWPRHVAVSPTGDRLAFVTDRAVHVWSWRGGRWQHWAALKASTRKPLWAAFSPDGSELATCGDDLEEDAKRSTQLVYRVRLWDLKGAQPRQRTAFEVPDAYAVEYALGGDALLIQQDEGCLLRDKKSGKQLWRWQPPAGGSRFALAPDRRHVALANSNGTIYIVRLKGPDKP